MAEAFVVTVLGKPFAVVTTEPNAVQLKTKINKTYEGNPADYTGPVLYNPKHADALARLDDAGELTDLPTPRVVAAKPARVARRAA